VADFGIRRTLKSLFLNALFLALSFSKINIILRYNFQKAIEL
jgi:hypothetical protein